MRGRGIEPRPFAWQAKIIPLNQPRISCLIRPKNNGGENTKIGKGINVVIGAIDPNNHLDLLNGNASNNINKPIESPRFMLIIVFWRLLVCSIGSFFTQHITLKLKRASKATSISL
ncbi:hypothetical protein BDF21DRAFT_399530 [Thamnidium elegans]|nr:hypothetical protein BDF21DRAFT_399530 [Thamnidium elegans]